MNLKSENYYRHVGLEVISSKDSKQVDTVSLRCELDQILIAIGMVKVECNQGVFIEVTDMVQLDEYTVVSIESLPCNEQPDYPDFCLIEVRCEETHETIFEVDDIVSWEDAYEIEKYLTDLFNIGDL